MKSPDYVRLRASVLAAVLVWGFAVVPQATAAPDLRPHLAAFYDDWLLSVDALILDAERQAFLGLGDDVERELFIRRFWHARGDEALERWRRTFTEARRPGRSWRP